MSTQPKLDAFGLTVSDMPTTLAFYRAVGLDIPAEADGEPHVDVELGGGVRLMFDTVEIARSIDPEWEPPSGSSRFGLAFRCADPAAVDEVHARVVGLGYQSHKEPWDAFWGQRYAMLRDPDGNGVDLYADNADEG